MKNFKKTGWIEEMQYRLDQNKIAIVLVMK